MLPFYSRSSKPWSNAQHDSDCVLPAHARFSSSEPTEKALGTSKVSRSFIIMIRISFGNNRKKIKTITTQKANYKKISSPNQDYRKEKLPGPREGNGGIDSAFSAVLANVATIARLLRVKKEI